MRVKNNQDSPRQRRYQTECRQTSRRRVISATGRTQIDAGSSVLQILTCYGLRIGGGSKSWSGASISPYGKKLCTSLDTQLGCVFGRMRNDRAATLLSTSIHNAILLDNIYQTRTKL